MERLTKEAWRNLDPWECCGQDNYCKRDCHAAGGCTKGCIVPKIYDRLAAYEDTGLTPSEVSDLARAKQEGRLVVLPCKVGDTVYSIQTGMLLSETVTDFETRHGELCALAEHCIILKFSDFGRTVFLNRESAEAALKGAEQKW